MANVTEQGPRDHPAVRHYTVLCLLALVVLVLALLENDYGAWSLLPVLVGSVALALHWTVGPPLLLICLAFVVLTQGPDFQPFRRPPTPSPLADLALCVGVLGYVAGHYRLQSLVHHVFPPDPRRRGARAAPAGAAPGNRSPDRVTTRELVVLVLSLPLWSGLACLAWLRLTVEAPHLYLPAPVWRAVLVIWILGLGLGVTAAVLAYLGQTQATRDEGLLCLQDQLWRQTRREQNQLNRWLTWARLRGQHRKEKG